VLPALRPELTNRDGKTTKTGEGEKVRIPSMRSREGANLAPHHSQSWGKATGPRNEGRLDRKKTEEQESSVE